MMVLLGEEAQVEAHFWSFGDSANHDAPDDTPRLRGSCRILFWSIWRQCQRLCKIGARFAPNVLQAQISFWTHPMELLGDVGHVEPCFGPFGDDVSVGARQVHGLNQMYHMVRNRFGCSRWYPSDEDITCSDITILATFDSQVKQFFIMIVFDTFDELMLHHG